MRNIIIVILILISSVAFGQGTINFGASRPQDTSLSKGQLKLTAYSNSNSTKYLTVNSNGYVVFGVPAGGGSSGDSTVFFTVYRSDTMRIGIYGKIRSDSVLMRGLITSLTNYTDSLYTVLSTKQGADSLLLALQIDSLRDYVDSNNTIIYGSIAALYDTLPNYVDTAMLNDSLQAIKAAYVPYTGATTNVNLGSRSLTTNKVIADTLSAKSSMGIHLHGTGGQGIMVGAGGGGNITFDAYPTTVIGDSVLSTNSGGGVFRYDLKSKLATYLLKTDSTNLYTSRGRSQKLADSVVALIPSSSTYVPYTGATTDVNLGTHTFTAKDGVFNHSSGSGVALSVTKGGSGEALTVSKTSGSGNAMSVTGGVTQLQELHTTTDIADAYIASAATWNAKGNGTVTSIQLVGGTNVTITPTTAITTSGVYTISATGGSSTIVKANEFNMLYKANGDTTIRGTTKLRVDTVDSRVEFAYDADTARVPTDPHGGVKIWGSNRMGMGAVRINDTVSIPAALQRAFNGQVTSTIMPILNNYQYTGAFSRTNPALEAVGGGVTSRSGAYNATIQQLNYNISLATTGSSAGSQASLYINTLTGAPGLICGNTKFSGGGGRGTFNFCLPNYGSGNRIFIGYSTNTGNSAADPSTFTGNATIGIGKDAADNTLHFMHSSGVSGSVTKVNTGVTPNNENVYRVTVYVAPNSTFYIQLEVMSKTGTTTHVLNPTTNVPPVETKLVMRQLTNNGLAGGVCSYGFIYFIEEIY